MGLDCHIGALHSLKQNGPLLMQNGQMQGHLTLRLPRESGKWSPNPGHLDQFPYIDH